MNISFYNRDAVRGILKLEIGKADYAEQVDKGLRSFRQKANLPGFRKGMVPLGMVQKMYGKHILSEAVDKLVSDNLFKYLKDNNVNFIGDPLPNETEQKEIDFDTEDFEFYFDIAFIPEVNIGLSESDALPYYEIEVDDDLVNKQIENQRQNFGTYDEAATEVASVDVVKGTAAELENGAPKAGGIVVEDATLMPMYLKDDEEKAKFIGATLGSTVVFNPRKGYGDTETVDAELASFLKKDKAEVSDITSDFSFEIKQITHYKEAELNQEFFDKIFGEGIVTSEEAYREEVKKILSTQFVPQSDYKLLIDARPYLLEKAGELPLADDILKRRLLLGGEEKLTPEQVEEQYPDIAASLRFNFIKSAILEKNGLQIEEHDVEKGAHREARALFAQYGMHTVGDEVIDGYAKKLLADRKSLESIIDRAKEDKLIEWLKQTVTLDVKPVTADEFSKFFQPEG
ncbi:trigger factor [Bacteroidia bacterium]|nr:trigger factor [Bacteroidia bacterium]